MAELLYRESSNAPIPGITSVKGQPLSNIEVDGNFRSLNADIQLRAPINNPMFTGLPIVDSTSALMLPRGLSTDRPPTIGDGAIRYNTLLERFEGKARGVWDLLGGGATGAPGNSVFFLNDQTVTGNYTIPDTKNAGTFGPVTVNTGVVVTVPSNSVWSIV